MPAFNFFRTPKPQRYGYIPRYYDPDKEALEQRRRLAGAKGQTDDSPELVRERVAQGFRRRIGGAQADSAGYRSKAVLSSNLRLLAIVLALGLICWALLMSPAIGRIIEGLMATPVE